MYNHAIDWEAAASVAATFDSPFFGMEKVMAGSISASVGSYESGAKNLPADVRTVQELLTQAAKKLHAPAFDPKGVDGKIARPGSRSSTVTAITNFQRQKVGMMQPDQRIDVRGKTWNTLVAAAGPIAAPGVGPLPTKPVSGGTGMIIATISHGGKIPTNTKFKVATPSTAGEMYESTLVLSGGLSGSFRCSIYPDDMTVKGRVVDGSYPLHIGFHKGGSAAKQKASDLVVRTEGIRAGLLVNARNGVPVQSDNASKTTSYGINVHNGFNSKRGSDGCVTIRPTEWPKFIQAFLDAFPNIDDWHTLGSNTGKKIGTLIIQP